MERVRITPKKCNISNEGCPKSPADFISKMGTVEEEADESLFWMELLIEAGIVESGKLESLMKEADELLAITVASINTAKRNR